MRVFSKGSLVALLTLALLTLFATSLSAQTQFDNFVYTNDDVFSGENTVSAYGVGRDGTLTPLQNSPYKTGGMGPVGGLGGGPTRITVGRDFGHPITGAGNFLFVTNEGSNDISVFSIDPLTGLLIDPLTGLLNRVGPFPTHVPPGPQPSLAVTPDNRFLYSVNSSAANFEAEGTISKYDIAANGALTWRFTRPLGLLTAGVIKMSPNGKVLAIAGFSNSASKDGVLMLNINPDDGSLTPGPFLGLDPICTVNGCNHDIVGLDIDCANKHLFVGVGIFGGTGVHVFDIDPNSGTLSEVNGSPFTNLGVGYSAFHLLLSPGDAVLSTSSIPTDTVATVQFTKGALASVTDTSRVVDSNATQVVVKGSPFSDPGGPFGITTDEAGTFLYSANLARAIGVFSMAPGGFLTNALGSPVSTGQLGFTDSVAAFPPKSCGTPSCASAACSIRETAAARAKNLLDRPYSLGGKGYDYGLTTATGFGGYTSGDTISSGYKHFGVVSIAKPIDTGAQRSGNVVTITTLDVHKFSVGQTIIIAGVQDPSFNSNGKTFTITSTPSATTFTYNQSGPDATSGKGTATGPGGIVYAPGIDCSGLVLWSYNTGDGFWKFLTSSDSPIQVVDANDQFLDQYSQFLNSSDHFDSSKLEPGDLLFFNYEHRFDEHGLPITADHVAMYVGPTARNNGGEVIEAYSDAKAPKPPNLPIGVISSPCNADPSAGGCARANKDPEFTHICFNASVSSTCTTDGTLVHCPEDYSKFMKPCFLGFKRPINLNANIGLMFETHSPIGLIVTDPEGFTITPDTRIVTSREVLRIVAGQLSYVINSDDDDTVIAHTLKAGAYLVKPVPKPTTSPGDIYSLTVTGVGTTLTLAQNVPISEIPSLGYGVESTGSRIAPFIPVAIDIKPGSSTNPINPRSSGTIPVAILSSASFHAPSRVDVNSLKFGRTGAEPSLAFCAPGGEDVNGDGLADLVCHFYTQNTGFQTHDTKGILRGLTVGGELIRGADSVRIGL